MSQEVTGRVVENYQVQLVARRHAWLCDEPIDERGDDLAPNPFELLLGAVASCTLITAKHYAAEAGLPVEMMNVSVRGEWERRGQTRKYRIRTRVNVRGELSEDDLERIKRAAGRCPVKRVLEHAAIVETEVQAVARAG